MGSVIKKRRKRVAKKKHRKLLRKTRHQRRNKKGDERPVRVSGLRAHYWCERGPACLTRNRSGRAETSVDHYPR